MTPTPPLTLEQLRTRGDAAMTETRHAIARLQQIADDYRTLAIAMRSMCHAERRFALNAKKLARGLL